MSDPRLDAAARARLLRWYRRHRRLLPWREAAPDAYRVWVSEIMLQQTQVAVVIPYYRRFLQRFPDIAVLAAAPEAAVLAAWSGLGYYRRARQLHQAARRVMERHAGEFPRTAEAARALPGIGAYTAGAILSIAAGARLPAVDGNAARIASRLLGRRLTPAAATPLIAAWLPARVAGTFNQALMDLGATVCLPRQPDCDACPLRRGCAHAGGTALAPPPRAPRTRVVADYLLARRDGQVWLRRRAAAATQLAGLWELPPAPPGRRARPPVLIVRHAITTRDITARIYVGAARGAGEWMSAEQAAAAPLTGLTRKILRRGCGWKI